MCLLTLHSPVYLKNSNRITAQCATAKVFHVINSCLLAALWRISEGKALTANLKQGKTKHASPPLPLVFFDFKQGWSSTPPYISPIVLSHSFLSALQDDCPLLLSQVCSFCTAANVVIFLQLLKWPYKKIQKWNRHLKPISHFWFAVALSWLSLTRYMREVEDLLLKNHVKSGGRWPWSRCKFHVVGRLL